MADATVFSLEADPLGVVRSLGEGVEGSSTLRVGVVVVVLILCQRLKTRINGVWDLHDSHRIRGRSIH
jgi:hypothetical protein